MLIDAYSMMWLLLVTVLASVLTCAGAFHVTIVCAMDLFRGYVADMEGYSVPAQDIGHAGSVGVSVLLPEEWRYAKSCCHRIQITLFPQQLTAHSHTHNVSSAEWTHCTSDVKHMTCVVQPTERRGHEEDSHEEDSHDAAPDPMMMLALSLQQCQQPELNQINYELFVYSNSSSSHSSPAPVVGTADMSEKPVEGSPGTMQLAALRAWLPCVMSGGLHTAQHHFPLMLGQLTIHHPTSFSYSFTFIMDKPSNDVIFEVLFLSRGELPAKLCDGKPHISLFQLHAPRKLSLSIGSAWAGCRVENVQGEPMYLCEGGRTFVTPGVLDIYVTVCKQAFSTLLNYTLEILESRQDCSLQAGFSMSSAGVRLSPSALLLSIAIAYSQVLGSRLAHYIARVPVR